MASATPRRLRADRRPWGEYFFAVLLSAGLQVLLFQWLLSQSSGLHVQPAAPDSGRLALYFLSPRPAPQAYAAPGADAQDGGRVTTTRAPRPTPMGSVSERRSSDRLPAKPLVVSTPADARVASTGLLLTLPDQHLISADTFVKPALGRRDVDTFKPPPRHRFTIRDSSAMGRLSAMQRAVICGDLKAALLKPGNDASLDVIARTMKERGCRF